jgi:hypothetical protein
MGIAAVLEGWWSDRIAARDYQALGPGTQDALAREAGVSKAALDRIVARGSRAGRELPRLLRAVELDPDTLKQRHPGVMRDMQAVCSTCAVASRCRRDLGRLVSRATFETYCPNAATVAALGARTWRRASA